MGISVWQLLIILAIVLVLFGAKRLRNVGGDLGGAIKGFRQAMKEEDDAPGRRGGEVLFPELLGGCPRRAQRTAMGDLEEGLHWCSPQVL